MIERALAANPNDVSAYLAKGRALIFSGQPDAGKETSSSLFSAFPMRPCSPATGGRR
ncbi:MAG: hypothetical protein LAQ30_16460 [Acidobacteriia bacterium]|nr:hypothetical protein [Terriglobia bacterium]